MAKKMMTTSSWRENIYSKLKRRNCAEYENIKDLIENHNKLVDINETLRFENNQLSLQNEKLRLELSQQSLPSPTPASLSGTNDAGLSIQQLEQKIYRLQEELTELHRRKGENAQQLVDLNHCLQEKDKQLLKLQNSLAEVESELMLSRENGTAKDGKISELESLVQLLRDEYQALNLIYNAIEQKYKAAQDEINDLVQRWMALKAKDAEKMNQENEAMMRKQQQLVEERLKEASQEARYVSEDDKFASMSPVCISTSLPNKAFLRFDAHDGEVTALKYSHQGRLLATGGTDRKIKLWDLSHASVDHKGMLVGSNAAVNAIDFDAEEYFVIGASNDFASRIWTVQDFRLRHTLTGHSGKVLAAKFLFEKSKVVTGSHDRTLKIWDLRSIACTRTLFAGSSCNDITLSGSNLNTIVSGHFDKKIRFWDSRSEQPINSSLLQGKITSLSLSHDGFKLLCSVRDDSLQLIDLRQYRICQSYTQEGFHIGADFTRAALSPDDAYAVCGGSEGTLFIWDVNSGKFEKTLKEHSSCVLACTWHPGGRTLVSCDKSKQVFAWTG